MSYFRCNDVFKERSSLVTFLVLLLMFFSDGFLYDLIIPLTPYSPANLSESWMLGLVYASYAVGVILSTPFFGLFSDRLDRRKPALILGALFQCVSVLAFAYSTNLYGLVFARLVQGVSAATTWTLGLALIAELFHEKRAQMMGFAMSANVLGLVIGPTAGGFLLEWKGYTAAFWLAGLIVAVVCVLVFTCLKEVDVKKASSSELDVLLRDRTVLGVGVIVALGSWCWSEIEALVPDHLEHISQASPAVVGLIFTASNIIYGFSCPLVGYVSDRYGSWRTTALGLFLMASLLVLMTFTIDVYWNGFLIILIGVAFGFAMNPTLYQLGEAVDKHNCTAYASVYAIYNIAYSMGTLSSSLAAGAIASSFSYEIALLCVSSVIFFALPICFYCFKARKPKLVLMPLPKISESRVATHSRRNVFG